MESVGNPAVEVDSWLPTLLDQLEPQETIGPTPFGRPPRMGLRAMAESAVALRDPANHYNDINQGYNDLVEVWRLLGAKLKQYQAILAATSPDGKARTDHHAHMFIVILSQSIATAMTLNQMLQIFEPCRTDLPADLDELTHDMMELGDLSLPYRPLGSLHILPGLSIAWAVESDPERRDYLARQLFQMYDRGFPIGSPMKEARWWKKKFAISRWQIENSRALTLSSGDSSSLEDIGEEMFIEPCHVQ